MDGGTKKSDVSHRQKNPRESGHDRHQQPGGIQFKNQEKKKEKTSVLSQIIPPLFSLWSVT
jgi:hypothetical protein